MHCVLPAVLCAVLSTRGPDVSKTDTVPACLEATVQYRDRDDFCYLNYL